MFRQRKGGVKETQIPKRKHKTITPVDAKKGPGCLHDVGAGKRICEDAS
jgi:hypothetical protein